MRFNLNEIQVLGNLTNDPVLKQLDNGNSVLSFGVATTDSWLDKNNVRQSKTQFHNCVVFGKPAETASKFLKEKGQVVLVKGAMEYREYVAKDGTTKKVAEIKVLDLVPLHRGTKTAKTTEVAKPEVREEIKASGDLNDFPDNDVNPEDIPF